MTCTRDRWDLLDAPETPQDAPGITISTSIDSQALKQLAAYHAASYTFQTSWEIEAHLHRLPESHTR